MRHILILSLLCFIGAARCQNLTPLTVDKIMRDPKWIGIAPSNPFWVDKTLFFTWNPDRTTGDSLYAISLTDPSPKKISPITRQLLPPEESVLNKAHTKRLFEKYGDLFLTDIQTQKTIQITHTVFRESNSSFSNDEKNILFVAGSNLFSWEISSGILTQHTNFKDGDKAAEKKPSAQEKWLKADQLANFEVLRKRTENKKLTEKKQKSNLPKSPKEIYTGDKQVDEISITGDGNFIVYQLTKNQKATSTAVPNFITESGFTSDLTARPKVGAGRNPTELFVYDVKSDTVFEIKMDSLPGITDLPDYKKDYPEPKEKSKPEPKAVSISQLIASPNGKYFLADIRSVDFKDRWLTIIDPTTHKQSVINRQHDNAWVGWQESIRSLGWLDDNTVWFVSEETGFSHLYTLAINTKEKRALTMGKYEVQSVHLSSDRKSFYLVTNEVHPGEKQFYRLAVNGGKPERLTSMTGAHEVVLSDDEKWIAYRYSYSNKPWELYIQENKVGAKPRQITSSLSEEFKSYSWRDPEVLTVPARDGANVYARLYKPANPNGAAVIFVHGAGYLQNAHRWWSSYFREFMFNNLLADKGYTVLDMDYRASAGYGRDWRTAIYRHMGGKDLEDNVDGARWLVEKYKIDPKRIGLYGGSYGGFITLMALFTTPDTFAAGAALRPVTDWAHYNDPYTGSILNEPFTDSLSYARSSPIYYANGLKGSLLICHGMVDVNVHFQDAVRLAQRLIELGKDNWELAVYPMEDHGFIEPSSWTDEYKRILNLFEKNLR